MEKNKVNNSREILILAHNALSSSLKFMINKTPINPEVKKHCRLGLKIIGIFLADLKYGTGTHLLTEKEFDPFFACLPVKYYSENREHREWVCIYTVAKHMESCIKANMVVNTLDDKTENSLIQNDGRG
ncbi:hypothetical protein [Flavivirga sp. 57AJ16]|uniref:hypothetical protein n=1 Tax=Flavivirga sp. 57AJ16 TaxID=3025307 RepID=UPI00236542FD|nr:hypothetical protein [Flavivirga sp. 57AJ16]MDD7886736.1 hypothetical protein [Flavivirga sp. 57AJ16]